MCVYVSKFSTRAMADVKGCGSADEQGSRLTEVSAEGLRWRQRWHVEGRSPLVWGTQSHQLWSRREASDPRDTAFEVTCLV